jgi:hypothetical protein
VKLERVMEEKDNGLKFEIILCVKEKQKTEIKNSLMMMDGSEIWADTLAKAGVIL